MLFIISFVNYIDRASIAYAIEAITQEFHLSIDQKGIILGAFGIGYVFTSLLGGMAADHYGAKKTLIVAIFFWGLGSALIGVSTGFIVVIIARFILGLAEGPNFPSMARSISDWLPEQERNRALSASLLSVPISLALGGIIVTRLIEFFSWRGCYFSLAIFSVILLPFWCFWFKNTPKESPYVNTSELQLIESKFKKDLTNKAEEPLSWRSLLLNKTLLVNNWAFFVFGYYLFFFMTWLPSYLNEQYHLDLISIGYYSIIPWALAALLMWVVGVLADAIFKKNQNLRWSRSYPIMITQMLSGLCVVPILLSHSLIVTMVFISLAVGFAMSANASYYAVNIDVAKARVGTALGIMDAVFAAAGFIAPTLTGFIINLTGHFEAVFFLLVGLAFSSTILTFLFHNR